MAAITVSGTRAEAMRAAMEACCCGGSGSGSGGGGRAKVACCDSPTPTAISWNITGTTGSAACVSNTVVPDLGECLLEPDDQSGFRCGLAAAVTGTASYFDTCIDGAKTTTITITLCCAEPEDGDPEFPTRYRMAIYLQVVEGITSKSAQWCTEEFDLASCDPFLVEMDNWVPLFDEFGGALATVVFS